MQEKTRRRVKTLLTWALTVGVAAAVVAAVDRRALAAALSRADARLLAAALAVTILGNLLVGPARWTTQSSPGANPIKAIRSRFRTHQKRWNLKKTPIVKNDER